MAPFAGFDDFDECLRTMTEEEGHDQSAAERICGALQDEAKSEHGNVQELKDALARGRGLIADVGVDLNSAVDQPAINSKWVMFKSEGDGPNGADTQIDAPLVLKQADSEETRGEKRIAYAPAMIPREVDKEGDVVPTPAVERAAHNYLKNDGGVDSDHDLVDGKGEPVESWVEPEEKSWDLPDGSTETYPAGTWMVGIEWDAKTWERIQNGELEGLSIYGKADHVPLGKSASEGATPKNDARESSTQDSTMSDNNTDADVDGRLQKVESEVSEVAEAVDAIKDAVDDLDKQPEQPGGDAGSAIRDAAQALANHDDVPGNADEIASDLKSMYLDAKEDGDGDMGEGMDDDGDGEDDEDVDVTAESSASDDGEGADKEETEKDASGDPNFSKTDDGGDAASVAKDAQNSGTGGGVPSYREAVEDTGGL